LRRQNIARSRRRVINLDFAQFLVEFRQATYRHAFYAARRGLPVMMAAIIVADERRTSRIAGGITAITSPAMKARTRIRLYSHHLWQYQPVHGQPGAASVRGKCMAD